MKVSVITTIKNEEKSIRSLLDSLISQSKMPDEIIIVDGGSIDRTAEIIKSYKNSSIKLIIEKNVNIARGRNIAISNAKNRYIASIDGGCIADKNWIKNLLEPFLFDSNVDVVSGFFLPDARSFHEEIVGELLYPKAERIDPEKFLPSGRSIAFKKACWERVGGYPEWLYTGEDTLFDIRLNDAGCRFVFRPDAIVYWRPRSTLYKLMKQYFGYARGAAQAGISHTIFEAYGENSLNYVLKFLKPSEGIINIKKPKKTIYISIILFAIFFAKLAGVLSSKITGISYQIYK